MRELLAGRCPPEAAARLPAWQRLVLKLVGPRLQGLVSPRRLRALTRLWMPLGHRVAIVGGDLAAIELAELLAERGRRVSVLEPGPEIAPEVGVKRRAEHMDRLDRLGVTVHTEAAVERIDPKAVVFANGRRAEADSVILAGELVPDTSLLDALKDIEAEVVAVGDCTGLGLIRKAVEEGARAAAGI
jgi:2,4-dienoyl-CoA reductase (NADPH2)